MGESQLTRAGESRRKQRDGTAVMTALDVPILHLVDAEAASNDVKFKAGAELSKVVN